MAGVPYHGKCTFNLVMAGLASPVKCTLDWVVCDRYCIRCYNILNQIQYITVLWI